LHAYKFEETTFQNIKFIGKNNITSKDSIFADKNSHFLQRTI